MFKVNDILKLKQPEYPYQEKLRYQVFRLEGRYAWIEVIGDTKNFYKYSQETLDEYFEKVEYLIG